MFLWPNTSFLLSDFLHSKSFFLQLFLVDITQLSDHWASLWHFGRGCPRHLSSLLLLFDCCSNPLLQTSILTNIEVFVESCNQVSTLCFSWSWVYFEDVVGWITFVRFLLEDYMSLRYSLAAIASPCYLLNFSVYKLELSVHQHHNKSLLKKLEINASPEFLFQQFDVVALLCSLSHFAVEFSSV